MSEIEQMFEAYLESIAEDEEFTPAEAAVIMDELRHSRELHLCRTADFYEDEQEDGDPEYVLFCSASTTALEADDDPQELLDWAGNIGVTVRPHFYPWAGHRRN